MLPQRRGMVAFTGIDPGFENPAFFFDVYTKTGGNQTRAADRHPDLSRARSRTAPRAAEVVSKA